MKITMDLAQTIVLLAAVICSANAYSKYGRSCKDIGCRPSETCVISHDSCSWSQQEGKECGSYPTCKRSSNTNTSPGANLNPSPDNSRVNPYGSNNHGNNYNPGSYNPPSNTYGGGGGGGGGGGVHQIDPNQIFGNPNRVPQGNPMWNNVPIFNAPNPTSGQAQGHQPIFQQSPQNYYPQNVNVPPGLNPLTDIFGHPPPGLNNYVYPPPRGTTRTPGQFYASGRRRNFSTSMHTAAATWQHYSFIVILSVCNMFVGLILTARH